MIFVHCLLSGVYRLFMDKYLVTPFGLREREIVVSTVSGQCVYKCGPSCLKSTVVASNHVLPYLFCFHSSNFN